MYSKHSYQGTARIVQDVCGRVGLALIKREEQAPGYIDTEQYKKDLSKLRSLALDEKRVMEGSSVEKIIARFFGREAGDGLNKRVSEARHILGELEMLTEKYANYEQDLTDTYYSKRKMKLDAAKNVKDCESIIEKLEYEKSQVYPKPKAVGNDEVQNTIAEKEQQIALDRKIDTIEKDISLYRDSSVASALIVKYARKEIEQLDEYRKHVNFIVDNTRRTIICGSMFIDHVETCKNYLIDGEEVLTRNMEFQKALFDIRKNMDSIVENVDQKMEIFGVYMGMDPFRQLFSNARRRKLRLKSARDGDNELIQEALKELEPGRNENTAEQILE